MEKVIWVIGDNREEMIEAQRRINSTGSMRARCLLSPVALERAIQSVQENEESRIGSPSLLVVDYRMAEKQEFQCLSQIKMCQALVGVPLFFMMEERTKELDEKCFSLGATVVMHKPFSKSGILRMEHSAWQHEVTKSYEKTLQKQVNDLRAAREIMRLNQQLEARNELLYQVFGRYFSDDVLEVILEHPEEISIGGERRDAAVMFADLRGFTSLSEEIEPERVSQLLNMFLERMLGVIQTYHGTVIEFLGDSILAVFGAPLTSETPMMDAAKAAIQMQNTMKDVNEYCTGQGYEPLEMGIGLHCGDVFIGNVGSEKMMRYNVIGKEVNVCSRIEGMTVGGQVLLSEELYRRLDDVQVGNSMTVLVKGIREPIALYELLRAGDVKMIPGDSVESDWELREAFHKSLIQIYPIQGKVVSKLPVEAQVEQVSEKQMEVSVKERLELFTDVKLMATMEEEADAFHDVYGKVIAETEGKYLLHITHTNQEFHAFVQETLMGDSYET